MRYRIEMVIDTADLAPTSVQAGNYPDPHFVGSMFANAIAGYEADEDGRMLSFKIERLPELQ